MQIEVFQPRNNPFNSSFNSLADKQGICLKMYEVAISETLIFKTFCSGMPQTLLEARSYKHIWPAFGVLKLGVYLKTKMLDVCEVIFKKYSLAIIGQIMIKMPPFGRHNTNNNNKSLPKQLVGSDHNPSNVFLL